MGARDFAVRGAPRDRAPPPPQPSLEGEGVSLIFSFPHSLSTHSSGASANARFAAELYPRLLPQPSLAVAYTSRCSPNAASVHTGLSRHSAGRASVIMSDTLRVMVKLPTPPVIVGRICVALRKICNACVAKPCGWNAVYGMSTESLGA